MLSAGENLGPYKIEAPIGKGGMGEVYRGTDSRLNRPVAIKISAREFSDRFEREARAISALNHPNICTLYDVGPNYLVMELVEGEMLSRIIERGPLPLDKALSYAVQIVDALAAAHAKGVIHRDLKPGNIIVTKNGVKVLDFGLAKLSSDKPSTEAAASIETVTEPITRAGAILGTLYYMPPEQVEGKEADERSDIFSFGVVLYEMVTGERPFSGDTQAAVLAAILKDSAPPMSQRQPATPRALERLVRRCLEKKSEDRWNSALDLKRTLELIDLDAPPSTTTSASIPIQAPLPRGGKRGLWLGIAAAALIAAAGAGWGLWPKAAPARATRFQVTLPQGVVFDAYVSVSPDGHKLLFNATGTQSGFWVHDLDTLEWRRLAGTEDAVSPFWSPDSRFLGFGIGSDLKKIEVAGGPPQTLCAVTGAAGTGAWSKDGVIVFGHRGGGVLQRVSAAGGVATDLTAIDPARGEVFHALPTFLPDQKHFLYLRTGTADVAGIYAGSIDLKPAEQPKQRILANKLAASYVDGNLFFMRDGTLMVQPFDAGKLQLTGDAVPVAEHVAVTGSIGIFSASPTGVLAYRTGTNSGGGYQTTWFDREGKQTSVFGQLGPEGGLALAPDGMRAAGRDALETANGDIWLLDFNRGVRTRLTFRQSTGSRPVWSSDGSHIFFAAGNALDGIYEKDSSGAGEEKELLKKPGEPKWTSSVSRDGKFLLYNTALVPKTGPDLWVLPLEGQSQGKPALLLGTGFAEGSGSFSPDGRWIAYVSNETGRFEVYIRPFVASATPAFGEGKWQVSRDGVSVIAAAAETTLKWRKDGKELLFMGANNVIMAVDVNSSGAAPGLGTPKPIFTAPQDSGWDATSDDSRFLMSVLPGSGGETPITVVLNWQADLKR
ncbi:MAG TPA: protein kinase [Bryobacteraceae bacterium]|nr:protein kinase [Bryobacteraceae bacterium]